jgi:hypothetical protein
MTDALLSALTATPTQEVTSASITTWADVPSITDVITSDGKGNWYSGTLDITITEASYYAMDDLTALVAAIGAAFKGASKSSVNTWQPPQPDMTYDQCPHEICPNTIANVPGHALALLTQDTAAHHDWREQVLGVQLTYETPAVGAFACADVALVMDSLAALALIPGLEVLGFMAVPAWGASVSCDALDHMRSDTGSNDA